MKCRKCAGKLVAAPLWYRHAMHCENLACEDNAKRVGRLPVVGTACTIAASGWAVKRVAPALLAGRSFDMKVDQESQESMPIGMTCRDCKSFEACSWLINLSGDETVCDWNPSRFQRKYYGFHVKTKSWEELSDTREVMIAGRKIIISRPWENSDSWTATEPETGASVLTFFEETPEAAISVAELTCCISEERWQEAIANAKAYPGWHPCPCSQGEHD